MAFQMGHGLIKEHGLCSHPLYNIWISMRKRCNNPNNESYKDYGGRGIIICDRWNNFQHFYDDMFPTWEKGLTIDRIDNDGNYESGNCRWATSIEQNRNARSNRSVASYTTTGELVKEYEYLIDVRLDGFDPGHVCKCCQSKRNTHKKLIWKYI